MKHVQAKTFKKVSFDRVLIGKPFGCNGNDYIKKSSRTAHMQGQPDLWFYFGKNDICETVFYMER